MANLLLREQGAADRTLPLVKERFVLGKREDCDVVMNRPNISRQHCEILQHDGKYLVRDLNSANGTYVNGARISAPMLLTPGAVIQLGDYTMIFQDASAPAPALAQNAAASGRPRGTMGGAAAGSPSPMSTAGIAPPRAAESAPSPAPDRSKPIAVSSSVSQGPVISPELKKRIHQRLLEHREIKRLDLAKSTESETREKTRDAVLQIFDWMANDIPEAINKDQLLKEIMDEALGLGPLEDLLADDDVSEIMVCNWDKIFVERKGKLVLSGRTFTDNDQVMNIVQRILAPIGRRVDESSPMVDGRLKDGSRVNAIIHPLAVSGPTVTIRKFMKKRLGAADLVKFGSMTNEMAEFLKVAVECRRNIVISGGTGSGKTTLLNVMSGFIPPDERIITVEDAAELRLPQEHVITLEAKPANIEGEGAIPIRKLVINTLRMRPDRIVVGECRGGEAFDMLQAMNTGHDGSLTTIHSNTPRDCIARIENLVLMAGMDIPAKAIREQIASAIHMIVQQCRLSDGSRRVTYITEVTGIESGTVTLQDIFLFKQSGITSEGKIKGLYKATGVVPKFYDELRERGKKLDMRIFQG
ncbi:MAG: Flp pilus assembly complex ATPase component TadA [Planctomycetes bacterium]|nr:Flp pilus assembly complex ATPase component TadA [Planctomycetota bacterium]